MMYRDDDKLAGMLAVIEEQQAAADLAVDRLTTIVERLSELGSKEWQQHVIGEIAGKAATSFSKQANYYTQQSIERAASDAEANIQKTAATIRQVKDDYVQALDEASGALGTALKRVLLVPVLIAALVCIGVLAFAGWREYQHEERLRELDKKIKMAEATLEALKAEPLTQTLITTCEMDGQRWWCIPVKSEKETWDVKGTPWKYRRIDGLPPLQK